MATWDDVRAAAAALPEAVEQQTHEWRVRGKLLAWERPLGKKDAAALGADAPEGEILAVRVPAESVKFELIADSPSIYFTIPHFNGYPGILIRLAELPVDELAELLRDAWLTQAPKRLIKESGMR